MKILYHIFLLLNGKKFKIHETERRSFFVTFSFKISVLFNFLFAISGFFAASFFANCPSLWCIIVVFHAAWINLKAWYQNISCNLNVYSNVSFNSAHVIFLEEQGLVLQDLFCNVNIVANCYYVLFIPPVNYKMKLLHYYYVELMP